MIFRQDTDGYDHGYYEKGLEFNTVYNREQLVFADGVKPLVKISGNVLEIVFKEHAKGRLHLQRPSDEKMDKSLAFQSDPAGRVETSLTQLTKGKWEIVLEWSSNNKQYTYQQKIFVP